MNTAIPSSAGLSRHATIVWTILRRHEEDISEVKQVTTKE